MSKQKEYWHSHCCCVLFFCGNFNVLLPRVYCFDGEDFNSLQKFKETKLKRVKFVEWKVVIYIRFSTQILMMIHEEDVTNGMLEDWFVFEYQFLFICI